MDTPSSMFPCWAAVSQMGHQTCYGFVTVTTELGTPMLDVAIPAVAGDERYDPLPAARKLVSPSSLYGVDPLTEDEVLEYRITQRRRVYRDTPLLAERVEDAVEVPPPADVDVDEEDDETLGERCAGCKAPAVTRDSMDEPLCAACFDALPLVTDQPEEPPAEVAPPPAPPAETPIPHPAQCCCAECIDLPF